MTYTLEKEIAITAVTRAAALCAQVRAELVAVNSLVKEDKSPVTIADFGAQALVCQELAARFPEDTIVAEEDSTDLQQPGSQAVLAAVTDYVQRFYPGVTPASVCDWIDAGNGRVGHRYWTLDPIDGTKGFLRNDQYAVALALVEEGQVKVGVLACPALPWRLDEPGSQVGVLFSAVRGEGATMAPLQGGPAVPIHVAEAAGSAGFRLVESVESGHGNQSLQQAVAAAVGVTQPSRRMDSQAKYGVVARGEAILYLRLPSPGRPDYREKIWDHAAGSLILTEAGGQVTDMNGRPLDFISGSQMRHNQGVVVSGGKLHPAVLAALARLNS